jgi:NAD-dependent dihydropyrimidine dehydrogenase PreA subunit
MNFLKTVWAFLFRLFPCPTEVGLRRVCRPKRDSPVLVTCNFHLTVNRLTKILERSGVDAWLLVADSKGVNVWCAAGGEEFNAHSVVSAVITSGIGDLVDHRNLILPPLGAPGISATEVRSQTGWSTRWGPVRAEDLVTYLLGGAHRDADMKRATYSWRERLDTALGCLFPIYLLGAAGFFLFGRHWIFEYLLTGAATWLIFFSLCPWIPGKRGITKAMALSAPLLALLLGTHMVSTSAVTELRPWLIIAIVTLLIWGSELGGLASTMPSDLDPVLARLGVGGLGNVRWAGKVRTELLTGHRELSYDRGLCIGCRNCYELCPVGVWEMSEEKRAVQAHREICTACRACLVQCPSGAIQAVVPNTQSHEQSAVRIDGTPSATASDKLMLPLDTKGNPSNWDAPSV